LSKNTNHIVHFDLVIPCYNPPDDWHRNIIKSYNKLKGLIPDSIIHLVVVNDGSTKPIPKGEIALLEQNIPSFDYLLYPTNRGKGYAIRHGMASAQKEFCIYTDIDFPYEEENIVSIIKQLETGETDIVIGVKNENYYQNVPKFRRFLSRTLQKMNKYILGLKVTDTQCGLKGFNQKGREVFLKTTIERYLFDLEFIYLASRNTDLKLVKEPLSLKPHVVFTSIQFKHLVQELYNFTKVCFRQ